MKRLLIDGCSTPLRIRKATNWWSRAIGLLATPKLQNPCGLWISPCNSVHTIGMRYAIDVVFLEADGTVAKVVEQLAPWRVAGCMKARSTLELRAGLARSWNLQRGVVLALDA